MKIQCSVFKNVHTPPPHGGVACIYRCIAFVYTELLFSQSLSTLKDFPTVYTWMLPMYSVLPYKIRTNSMIPICPTSEEKER